MMGDSWAAIGSDGRIKTWGYLEQRFARMVSIRSLLIRPSFAHVGLFVRVRHNPGVFCSPRKLQIIRHQSPKSLHTDDCQEGG